MTSPLLSPFASAFAAGIPPSVAALPFLFVRREAADDEEWRVRAALATAAAAERADESHRNTRGRLAYLLCELGFQLRRRGADRDAEMPLPRQELARTLDVSLSKVKRILALLTLSQVIATDGTRMRILDWKRLCGVAQYDPMRLEVEEDDEDWAPPPVQEPLETSRLTVAGDPACFV